MKQSKSVESISTALILGMLLAALFSWNIDDNADTIVDKIGKTNSNVIASVTYNQ